LQFILCGFSARSTNTETKVLSLSIDLGELVGLLSLYHLCKEIEIVYPPGAQVVLYTQEPFLYCMSALVQEKLGEPLYQDGAIKQYQRQLAHLVSYFAPVITIGTLEKMNELYKALLTQPVLPPIAIDDYRKFMKEELAYARLKEAARNKVLKTIIQDYPQLQNITTLDELRHYCSLSTHTKLYSQITSKLQINDLLGSTATALAHCIAHGATIVRILLSRYIPNYISAIRLSIRPSQDLSNKFGIALIVGSRGTPWHNTLVVTAKGACLKPRKNMYKNNILQGHLKEYILGSLSLAYIEL
jgi:hypothetical protein